LGAFRSDCVDDCDIGGEIGNFERIFTAKPSDPLSFRDDVVENSKMGSSSSKWLVLDG
jgi:hypothetical protein